MGKLKCGFSGLMAVLLLSCSLMFVSCGEDDDEAVPETVIKAETLTLTTDDLNNIADKIAGLGDNDAEHSHTIVFPVTVISDRWGTVNSAVKNAKKYVILDLSKCTATDNTIEGDSSPSGNDFNVIKNNTYIKGIILPESLESIDDYAFYVCGSLKSVTIHDKVTGIGNSAFNNCSSLTSITIPGSVTEIGDDAFYCCTKFTGITIPDSVTSIGDSAFSGCSGLSAITVGAGNKNYSSDDGVLFNNDKKTLVCYPAGHGTTYTIPSGVIGIGDSAFSYCDSLTSVTISDSVTSIGNSAFSNCGSLTSIIIPSSVTSIGNYAFSICNKLASVTFSTGSNISNDSFGSNAFPEGSSGSGGNSLKTEYATGKSGTYTRETDGSTWKK